MKTTSSFVFLFAALTSTCVLGQLQDYVALDGKVVVFSQFADGAGGWTITGDAEKLTHVGGAQGGYITAKDLGDGRYWYFKAPSKYLGDRSAAYGGMLVIEIRQIENGARSFNDKLLELSDGNTKLTFKPTIAIPATGWTTIRIGLDEREKGWTSDQGPVDRRTFLKVLGNLKSLLINVEHSNEKDVGGLRAVYLFSFNKPCQRYRRLLDEMAQENQSFTVVDGKRKSLDRLVYETQTSINSLKSDIRELNTVLDGMTENRSEIQDIRREVQEDLDNPYTQDEIDRRLGQKTALRTISRSPAAKRIAGAFGLIADAAEIGSGKQKQFETRETLTDYVKSCNANIKEMILLIESIQMEVEAEERLLEFLQYRSALWKTTQKQFMECVQQQQSR